MKKYVFIVLMSGLVLFLFSGLRSIESVKGQDSEDFRTKSVTPIQEQPYFPVNLCLNSIVTEDSKEAGVEPVQSPELLKVIDGDLSTFLNKECNEQSWVKVKFRYRPRWVNQIKIAHGGTVPYVVEYLGLDDSWHVAGTYEASPTPGSPLHSEAFDFNPVRAKAIRWRTVFGESPKGSIAEIYEIEAYFSQTDKGDDGLWEVGVEWVEDYPGKKNDRRYSGISATELYNRVGGRPGWSKVFNRGDRRAMEKHFKRRGSWPGGEEDHWIDRVDLAYFHGHGTRWLDWNTWTLRRALLFANWRHDPWLFPSDGKESWGDRDLEWIGFSACKTMRDHRYWARCMDGLHLILGWETVCYNVIFGKYWADGMIHGPDRRIMQAWFNAADQTHGNWLFLGVPPGVYSSLVIAESIQNLNDGLWGMGVVHPCTPDDYYHCIRHRTVKVKEEVKGEVFSELLDDLSDPLVLLPSQTEKGMPIKYKSPGLSSGEETTMVMYDVIPRSVDSAYIQNIANSMCEEMGVLCCTTEVEWDGVGHLWMVCGSEGLRVSEASGGVRYINSEWWMSLSSQPPTLLSEAEAIDSANTFLNAIDFLPNDAYFHIVCYPQIARAHKETGEVDPDSSWYTGVEVCYRRETASGYPVVGPGAVLNVTYGDDGRLERWALGGWRDIAPGRPEVPIITVEEAMELIATEGSDATIGGIPYCDTVVVIDAALAYYEENTDEVQDYLEIIWVLASLCISEYDTTEAELFVPARFLPPRGSIDAPPDSSWFAEGDMVTLIGSATSGTPPYTFDWYSDVDGYLGSGNTISTDDLSMICEDGVLSPHTITMIVTDANGSFDYANISLWIGEMTWGNQVIIPNMVYERFGFGHWDYDGEIYVDDACYPYIGINPGDFFEIPIILDNFQQVEIGGFELEVEFDYIDLTFYGAMRGGLLEARYTVFDDELDADIFWSWEYFSYRVLPCTVPHKYKILLFGLSDMPDGLLRRGYCLTTNPTFPEEYWAEDWAWYEDLGEFVKVGATLVWLKFQVANNELLRDLKLPIAFEWEHKLSADTNEFGQYYIIQDRDCAENTMSSCDGNVLYVSNDPLQYDPDICGDPEQNPPLTILDFVAGGVHICSPCTSFKCVRGDINLDHIAYTTADAVLFARYFVEGIHVFVLDRDEQVCATDVNADGRTLMLADLVYLIRVILRDAPEIGPKLGPSSEIANVIVSGNTITTECASPIGAILFEFDSAVVPTLLADMEMLNKGNKVLVWSRDGSTITTAEVLSFTGDAELVSVTAVDRDSRELQTSIAGKVAPTAFALNPAYPNPFNPFTNLSFTLPEAMNYTLKIYNVAGQLVRSYEGIGSAGLNVISWDSKDNAGDEVASGIYFYKLTAGSFSATRKMVVLK